MSEGEAYNIALRYFNSLEKMAEHWWENKAPKLEQEELEDALDNLRTDEVVFTGGSEHTTLRCSASVDHRRPPFVKGLHCVGPNAIPPRSKILALI
jgi:hypothetical protein